MARKYYENILTLTNGAEILVGCFYEHSNAIPESRTSPAEPETIELETINQIIAKDQEIELELNGSDLGTLKEDIIKEIENERT